MATGTNIITDGLSGNLGNYTFVKSRRYAPHLRRKRGTVKPALLNDKMKESGQRMAIANIPAKAIFDAVRRHHKDGELWNKLVVIFRKQLKAGMPFHVADLMGLECRGKSTLDRLLPSTCYKVHTAQRGDKLNVGLVLDAHPDWSYLKWKHAFQYRLSVVVVYPHLETGRVVQETAHGPITAFTSPVETLLFEVPIPGSADCYAAFLLADVCENGQPANQAHTKGMAVVGTGERVVAGF